MILSRRLSIAAAAALLAVPALSACGFSVQTDQVYTPAVGTNDRSGEVYVLDAQVVSETNGSGTVVAGLTNQNQQRPDALTSVTGAGADQGIGSDMGGQQITIAPGGFTQLANLKTPVTVTGSQVVPGQFVNLRFSFKNAQTVTMVVPVVARTADYKNVPMPSSSSASPSATPSPSASPTGKAKKAKQSKAPTPAATATASVTG